MRVGVLGGGLAGLTAAWELAQAGVRVSLFEATPRFGGQVHTERVKGFVVEHGAEGFGQSGTATHVLCRRLGLGSQLIRQGASDSWLLQDSTLTKLPPGAAAARLGIRAHPGDLGRGLWSLKDGMGALVDALIEDMTDQVELEAGASVVRAVPVGGGLGWRVGLDGGPEHMFDAIVVALPPAQLAALGGVSTSLRLSGACQGFPTVSSVSVSLAYSRDAVRTLPTGSGFVTAGPRSAKAEFLACSYVSSKWCERAPEHAIQLRVFARPTPAALEWPVEEWRDRAVEFLREALDITSDPLQAWVSRWANAIPRYGPELVRRVEAVRRHLSALGPAQLAGAGYEPSGVEGAVRSGRRAARRLVRRLAGAGVAGTPRWPDV